MSYGVLYSTTVDESAFMRKMRSVLETSLWKYICNVPRSWSIGHLNVWNERQLLDLLFGECASCSYQLAL